MKLLIISALYCALVCFAQKVSYDGFEVYRVSIDSEKHESEILQRLLDDKNQQLSEWADAPTWKDVMVHKSDSHLLGGFSKTLLISDVQKYIDQESQHSNTVKSNWGPEEDDALFDSKEFYHDYRSYEDIISYMDKFEVEKVSIGKTYENRDIYSFSFGRGPRHVVVNGGIHAREWISPAVVTYLAESLHGHMGYHLVNDFTFHFIPVLNPDGYHYTRTVDRLWRKNRQPNRGSMCVGTDPNRNFDVNWSGHKGSASQWSCMEVYHGIGPFSAQESKSLANYVNSLSNVTAYIDIHSYSQLFMYP